MTFGRWDPGIYLKKKKTSSDESDEQPKTGSYHLKVTSDPPFVLEVIITFLIKICIFILK